MDVVLRADASGRMVDLGEILAASASGLTGKIIFSQMRPLNVEGELEGGGKRTRVGEKEWQREEGMAGGHGKERICRFSKI